MWCFLSWALVFCLNFHIFPSFWQRGGFLSSIEPCSRTQPVDNSLAFLFPKAFVFTTSYELVVNCLWLGPGEFFLIILKPNGTSHLWDTFGSLCMIWLQFVHFLISCQKRRLNKIKKEINYEPFIWVTTAALQPVQRVPRFSWNWFQSPPPPRMTLKG